MKRLSFFLLLLISFFSSPLSAQERTWWGDFKKTLSYLGQGSYLQFTQINNAYYAAAAVPGMWYAFEHDDRLSDLYISKELPKHIEIVGDLGIAFNFPILPAMVYAIGRGKDNDKAMQFAMEYTAALYLTLAETGLMSFIDVHERPIKDGQSFWETAFRGDSSFPSGHIVPYSVLFFKTLQFYGPYWAIIPGILTYWSGYQRMQEGRHYFSDILGSFFLSAWASEGVRAAGKYKDNHRFYKWVFEHDVQVGIIRHQNAVGPRLSWNF